MLNLVRRMRLVVWIALFLAVEFTAAALPWGDKRPKLDPRDSAFAPVAIAPLPDGVPWGNPLAGGAVRALFIAPRFALRDAAELAHRLEMRMEIVALWDATHFGRPETFPRPIPGTSAEEVSAELRDNLDKKLDVIIAANFDFSILPPEDFNALAEKVRAGTGLVLAHHRHTAPDPLKSFLNNLTPSPDGAIVTHGIGETLTPEWANGLGFVAAGMIGEGRVVELDYQGEWPLTHCLLPVLANASLAEREDFDTYLSLAARAVRWAARRDVSTTIERVVSTQIPGPEAAQIPPGLEDMVEANLPGGASLFHPYRLELSAPADKTYTVRTGVRQRGRSQTQVTFTLSRSPLRKGATTYDFYAISGAGEYWLDIWLLDGEKVAEWYSTAIKIDSWPKIEGMTTSKTSVQPQDSIGITFTTPARKRPFIARVRATDAVGRIVAERHQPVAPDTALVQLGLGFADVMGDMLKVEVFASDRDTPVMPDWDTGICAYAYKYLPVRGPNPVDRFDIVADVPGNVEFNARNVMRGLVASGFDTVSFPVTEEASRIANWAGMHAIPRATSYLPYQTPPTIVRSPCLNDPAFISSEKAHIKGVAQIVRDYPATAVSLGDGNTLSAAGEDVCRCPWCIAGFGEYLRKAYLDIGALNRAWGIAAQSWENLAPSSEQDARAVKRYAPWMDFRTYMDSVFLRTHASAREIVRSADLRGRCGFVARGTDELFSGYHWPALASQLDMTVVPLDSRIVNIVRCAKGPAAFTGIEMPEVAGPEMLRWLPWYAVLHGARSVWWPDATASTMNVPGVVGVDPLGNPVPFAPEFFAQSSVLKNGLARLIFKASRKPAEIAVYTSRSSAWLNEINPEFGVSSAESERAFSDALASLGYPFDYVSPTDAEKGRLSPYRVLVLPMARALSNAEVKAISTFAKSGGCLIADVAPGTFDQHGVSRNVPPLADDFGVRYTKTVTPGTPASALVELKFDGAKASAEFTDIRADIGVEAAGAQIGGTAGASPVWILRTRERTALLINHAVGGETLERAHGLLDEVLRAAGARRVFDLESKEKRDFEGERFAFGIGKAQLVALLAAPNAANEIQKVRLHFEKATNVYDVLARVPVTRPSKVDVALPRGGIALYAALPYTVTACLLTVPPASQVGARLPLHVSLETKGGVAEHHLVRIDVFSVRTEGLVPVPHYGHEIVCANGEGNGFVPFAISDRMGPYKIVARDILTGVSAEAIVNLSRVKRD